MWILKDNFTKKMYFKGFSEISGLKNYTCNMDNALRFENEDEARHIANEIDADLVKIKK